MKKTFICSVALAAGLALLAASLLLSAGGTVRSN
ncbi:MAG: hypothetical protein Ct9H300mP16_13270 [Pseudomonadota bacterium]|nr:MAG: hypothetical protein Ct9H300mP16_13270 [Pseudomonadota bacterium]